MSEQYVSPWCETLFVRNGFRPVFLGRFQTFGNRVILIGKMVGMNGLVYLFVGAGLAMSLLFIAGTLLALIKGSDDPARWGCPLLVSFLSCFVMGMVRFGRWLWSGDQDWILAAI